MKKIIAILSSLLLFMNLIPVSAAGQDPIYHSYSIEEALHTAERDPEIIQVSFSEAQLISSLTEQGFTVEKVGSQTAYNGQIARSLLKIAKPLRTSAPNGSQLIPGEHYAYVNYDTFSGWNYFVSVESIGIALASSSYEADIGDSFYELTHGNQGIIFHTPVQYTYTINYSISVGGSWFLSASGGSQYIYRTNLMREESRYNFPLVS